MFGGEILLGSKEVRTGLLQMLQVQGQKWVSLALRYSRQIGLLKETLPGRKPPEETSACEGSCKRLYFLARDHGFIARRAAFMPSCLKQQQADRSSLRKNTAAEDASGGNLRMRAWTWRVLTIGQRPASWLPG